MLKTTIKTIKICTNSCKNKTQNGEDKKRLNEERRGGMGFIL